MKYERISIHCMPYNPIESITIDQSINHCKWLHNHSSVIIQTTIASTLTVRLSLWFLHRPILYESSGWRVMWFHHHVRRYCCWPHLMMNHSRIVIDCQWSWPCSLERKYSNAARIVFQHDSFAVARDLNWTWHHNGHSRKKPKSVELVFLIVSQAVALMMHNFHFPISISQ